MVHGEGDASSGHNGRSPGLMPALAFALVIIVALIAFFVLRMVIPNTPASATATAAPDVAPPVETVAPPAGLITATAEIPAPTAVPPTAAATRAPSPAVSLTATIAPKATAPVTATRGASPAATISITGTAAPVTAAPQASAAAVPVLAPASLGVPPVVYSFYDWQNTNWTDTYPSAGPVGSLVVFPWSRLQTGPDTYDWSVLDSYLAKASGMTVTLQDGAVISKPIILEIDENESEAPSKQITSTNGSDAYSARFVYHDYTPDFVRRQISTTLTAPITYTLPDGSLGSLTNDGGSYLAVVGPATGCPTRTVAIVPKYDNPIWQKSYAQFVTALGQRYNQNPQIVAVVFGPGIDEEYGQATKDYQSCPLRAQAYTLMPETAYLDAVVKSGPGNDLADAWAVAFPGKPLYFQFTSDGKDRASTLVNAKYAPPIGLKQASLTYDSNNQWQSNGNGTWQLMDTYSTSVPIAWENAYPNVGTGPAALQNRYFTILAGLISFPDFIDFNGWIKELSSDAPWLLDFTRSNLGRSITTTNEIWVAMRDTEYVTPTRGAVIYTGWPNDDTYGLNRTSDAPVVKRADLAAAPFNAPAATLDHPYAMIDRRTDIAKGIKTISFAADQRWPFWNQKPQSADPAGVWYEVTLKYLDHGTDSFDLVYQDYAGAAKRQTINKTGSNTWVTTTLTLADAYLSGKLANGADLVLDAGGGDEVIHMLSIKGHASAPPVAFLGDEASALSRSDWINSQSAARATATAVAALPGVLPTPTVAGLTLPLVLPTATAPVTSTAAPVGVALTPPGRPTIPAIYYAFYDWENGDFGKTYPDFPAIGSQPVWPWSWVNTGAGQYNWAIIDDYLAAAAKMTVTLQNGQVISKPIILEFDENESEVYSTQITHDPSYANGKDAWAARFVFHDYTPQFVKNAISAPLSRPITYATTAGQIKTLTTDGGSYLVDILPGVGECITRTVGIVPKYNNPTWLSYYKQFVAAVGARYNNNPQVVAVVAGPGIDEEFGTPTKNFFECGTRSNPYMSEAEYFDAIVAAGPTGDVIDAYRAAFPNKPVLLQFTGSGKDRADLMMRTSGYSFPVGLKQATLTQDNNNQWQTNGVGTLQLMNTYSQATYIAWENAYSYTGPWPTSSQVRYFTLLAGLMAFPNYMDFIGGWMLEQDMLDLGILPFAQSYLGRTITSTEDVWVALRDTDYYPPVGGGSIQFGGWHDDFSYGLDRVGGDTGVNNPVIKTAQMGAAPYNVPTNTLNAIYSLIARRTDNAGGNSAMYFAADPRWGYYNQTPTSQNPASGAWYDISLKYIDLGRDTLSFSYEGADGLTHTQTIVKTDTRNWVTTTVVISDAVWAHGLAKGADLIVSSDPLNGGLDEIIHMADIKGHRGAGPTETPSVSPTPKPTRTPTRPPVPTTVISTRTPTPSGSVTPAPTPTPFTELRVNAGGLNYVDSAGFTWVADQPWDGTWGYAAAGTGGTYTSPNPVSGTSDPELYQTERWFAQDSASYLFRVPNGRYEVELRFAEIFGRAPGKRVFNVDIDGNIVLPNFDIAALVGDDVALNRTFAITVTDNTIAVDLTPITDSAKINALRITVLTGPTPTVTSTATPGGATATPTRSATPTAVPPSPTRTATPTAVPPSPTRTATPTAVPASPSPTGAAASPTSTAIPSSPTVTTTPAPATPSPTATVVGPTPSPTPDVTLDGRLNTLEQRYQNLLNLVNRLVQILSMFGSVQ